MKKFFRISGYVLLVVVLVVFGLITYVKVALPDVGPAPDLKVAQTPERIARGSYLANNVTLCLNCHSTRDWTKYAGSIMPGTLGMGGEEFDRKIGFPGVYNASNITPEGIGRYTDGELYRVITTGVTKEGKAIFPVMPYSHYGKMDPEDVYSIIAYLRTLPPIHNKVAESVSDFPMNIIIHLIPAKAQPGKKPAMSDTLAYGAYLVNATGCIECHTRDKQGQIIPELAYSGGRTFNMPDGSVLRTPNITPDQMSGIGTWSREKFIHAFKQYADSGYVAKSVAKGAFNTIMPWTSYAGMSTEDLAAIYAFLRTIPPVENVVKKYTAPGAK